MKHPNNTTSSDQPGYTEIPHRWYRLTLSRKFALIFLCGVAIPVVALVFYMAYQSKTAILESTAFLMSEVKTSMSANSQLQQSTTESAFIRTSRELTRISTESLEQFQAHLTQVSMDLYASDITHVVSEFQIMLEQEFQTLNRAISHEIAALLEEFIETSHTSLSTLALETVRTEQDFERVAQFRKMLTAYPSMMLLQYFDSMGQSQTLITQPSGISYTNHTNFAQVESSLALALSGKDHSATISADDGTTYLQIFVPVQNNQETVGVIYGLINLRPIWEHINTRFLRHGEHILILDAHNTVLYLDDRQNESETFNIPELAEEISHDPTGTFQKEEALVAYTIVPRVDWTILVVQPISDIVAKIAPVQQTALEYITQLQKQLDTTSQEEVIQISQQISDTMEQKRKEARQQMVTRHEAFIPDLEVQINNGIEHLAENVHNRILYNVIPITLGTGFVAIFIGIFIVRRIIKPIRKLTTVAQGISTGNVDQVVPAIRSRDEIGRLALSFQKTIDYLQNIAFGAQKISEGELSSKIVPVSEKDKLGIAFKAMLHYLRDIAALATNISHGNLSHTVTPKAEIDVLGNAVYRMTLYFQRITQIAKKIAGGNLSENPQPLSEKDLLGNAFAEMIFRLRHLVSEIRTDAAQLVTMSQDSHSRAQEEAESVEKILLSVEETSGSMNEMAASIGEVNESMQHLSSYVGESSSSIEEMNSSIRQIYSHCEQLATASQETSSSIQEITASLQQIADTAQYSKMLSDGAIQDAIHGREAVEEMISSMKSIEHMVTVTAEAIQLLNRRTESIETILAVIKDISDQTSLLSINASIIAKKAGERGRGFNVIADKVRKLADQSNLSAKEIAMIIRDVRKESAHAVEVASMGHEKVREGVTLAELAGKALDKIITGADESSSVVTKIAETTNEQTRISHHIMASMEQVVDMVTQIKFATKEQEQSSTYLMKQVEQVLLLSKQGKQSTLEQTEVVKHVFFAMDAVRTLIQMTSDRARESTQTASLLSQHADALKQIVSQFTI